MLRKQPSSKRIDALVAECRKGKVIRLPFSRDERIYYLDPSGKLVIPWAFERALRLGLITPTGDALFPGMDSQTHRVA